MIGSYKMKNILFIHSSSELYGSDRSLLNIVKGIDKKKYMVYVILPCQGPLVEEMKRVPNVKVDVFEVAVLRRKNLSLSGGIAYLQQFLKSYNYLKQFIKDNKIDIVETNTAVVFPGAIAAKKQKCKSLWHIREIIKSDIENKVISFVMNRYADIIISNSIATGKSLKVSQDKVRVVYNAVDSDNGNNVQEHDGIIIGMAGRINRWKGQKLFVDAAEIVQKNHPETKFEIAGEAYEGEEYIRAELENYISEKQLSDKIQLLGQVEKMENFYDHIDIFVLPSIQPEPFGLVVIEAMEYGIPVVATNHGGPTEIIANGTDGYLVDFQKPDEMAQRIEELIEDAVLRKQMGKNGQAKKRKMFSLDEMITRMQDIYDTI